MNSSIEIAVMHAKRAWYDLEGVVEITQKKIDQTDCILVLLRHSNDKTVAKIPSLFRGYKVVVRPESEDPEHSSTTKESHEETLDYWNEERMNSARPIDLDIDDESQNDQAES